MKRGKQTTEMESRRGGGIKRATKTLLGILTRLGEIHRSQSHPSGLSVRLPQGARLWTPAYQGDRDSRRPTESGAICGHASTGCPSGVRQSLAGRINLQINLQRVHFVPNPSSVLPL